MYRTRQRTALGRTRSSWWPSMRSHSSRQRNTFARAGKRWRDDVYCATENTDVALQHGHLHRSSSRRLPACARLRVRHQDGVHPRLVRGQPQGLCRGHRVLPPGPDQGTVQGGWAVGAGQGVRPGKKSHAIHPTFRRLTRLVRCIRDRLPADMSWIRASRHGRAARVRVRLLCT